MKLAAALLFAAATASAGVTYDFRMASSGSGAMTIAGAVTSEAMNVRMEVETGDGIVFKDGSTVISRDGGKTLRVFDEASKTYFDIGMDEVTRLSGDLLGQGLTFDAPKIAVHDAGDGGAVGGYPTRKMIVDVTVVMRSAALGFSVTTAIHSENWGTDKLPASESNLFRLNNPSLGIEAWDKAMKAQASAFIGRFPLKQVSTVTSTANGSSTVSTMTVTVTNVRLQAIDASVFADFEGYKKVENPLDAARKRRQR